MPADKLGPSLFVNRQTLISDNKSNQVNNKTTFLWCCKKILSVVEYMSGELVGTGLTADHEQFSNSLKVADDNLDLRSSSQNEPQQDLEDWLKGNYAL